MKKFNDIKLIIFDYDNTLVDTKNHAPICLIKTAKKYYNLPLTKEVIFENFGKPFREYIKCVFGEVDSVDNIINNYKKTRENYTLPLFDNVLNIVNKLLDKYEIGILTASSMEFVKDDLNKQNFPIEKMYCILTSDDTEYFKPDPRAFNELLEKALQNKINKEEILYIGDSLDDLISAQGAGLNFIGVDYENTKKFLDYDAITIASFTKLSEIFDL